MSTFRIIPIVFLLFIATSCDSDGIIEEPLIESVTYDWKMEVNSIDYTTEDPNQLFFTNIIIGEPMMLFERVTNTTYFRFMPQSNKIEIKVDHGHFTIWSTPARVYDWSFNYELDENYLKIEGTSIKNITDLCGSESSTYVNKMIFEGFLVEELSSPTYRGNFNWTETNDDNVCIEVKGEMDVLKS